MTKKYICMEDAIENIRHMMDYDGFREGDCVSRRAVIGILDSMKAEVIPEIDWAFTSVTRNIGHRKLIDAYEFADMWRSYAITDEQRELSDRIARSAEEFREAKTDFTEFIEKRLEETAGPEHYYLEKLMRDWRDHE